MKLRPIQLVCFALLLSGLRLADASAFTPGEFPMHAGFLRALLSHDNAEPNATLTRYKRQPSPIRFHPPQLATARVADPRSLTSAMPTASRAAAIRPWTMRPPSAQYAALQSVTGFGRRTA